RWRRPRRLVPVDTTPYGPAVQELLSEDRLSPLGPGTPNRAVRDKLAALTPATVLAPAAVGDEDMAAACLAGLWLYHDYVDEAHTLSQEIAPPTGSYWHALVHRREPDLENSKYWFRRVGTHPIFAQLGKDAAGLGYRGAGGKWDPLAFVDHCARYL